jgi:hypothetical protein
MKASILRRCSARIKPTGPSRTTRATWETVACEHPPANPAALAASMAATAIDTGRN